MKIKSRDEVLNEVIKNGKKHPKNWIAIFGRDPKLLSTDYYILHPAIGVYILKEYEKNPFKIKGVGGKIARRIDEDIEAQIFRYEGRFGIIQGDFRKIYESLQRGVDPETILNSAIRGKEDYGLKMPVRGKATASRETFDYIRNEFSSKQKKLDKKFEEMAESDGLYKGYD